MAMQTVDIWLSVPRSYFSSLLGPHHTNHSKSDFGLCCFDAWLLSCERLFQGRRVVSSVSKEFLYQCGNARKTGAESKKNVISGLLDKQPFNHCRTNLTNRNLLADSRISIPEPSKKSTYNYRRSNTYDIKDCSKDSLLNGCDIHRTSAKLVIMEGRNNMQTWKEKKIFRFFWAGKKTCHKKVLICQKCFEHEKINFSTLYEPILSEIFFFKKVRLCWVIIFQWNSKLPQLDTLPRIQSRNF